MVLLSIESGLIVIGSIHLSYVKFRYYGKDIESIIVFHDNHVQYFPLSKSSFIDKINQLTAATQDSQG